MFLVEIFNTADFCNIVERFVVNTNKFHHASFLAGAAMDRHADEATDELDCFDYRVIEVDVKE